ncbi:MAG: hypothetical protein V1722_01385 [Candidatus Micrarchaeota archaeon]
MKTALTLLFLVLVALVASTSNVNALEVTPLQKSATLASCQQVVFPFHVTGTGYTSFEVKGLPQEVNYSFVPPMFVNGEADVNVEIFYPCDALLSRYGEQAFSLVATQGDEKTAGTSYVFLSQPRSLKVDITSQNIACACSSTSYAVTIRNNGLAAEKGTVLVSSLFPFTISDTGFDLLPGESVVKIVSIDLNCSTPAGVYPFSIALARENSVVDYYHSGTNVVQCFASKLVGPKNISLCYGDSVIVPFVLYNNGLQEQQYILTTSSGALPLNVFSIPAHRNYIFNVSIPSPRFPGTDNVTVSAYWNEDEEHFFFNLETHLCEGKPVPILYVAFPSLKPTFELYPGTNEVVIEVHNPYQFTLNNSVFSIKGIGPVSSYFDLLGNETKNVTLAVNVPENFTNRTTQLVLTTDKGTATLPVKIGVKPSPLSGLFFAGFFVGELQLIGVLLALVIIAVLAFAVYHQGQKRYIVDKEVSHELKKVLAKYQRK